MTGKETRGQRTQTSWPDLFRPSTSFLDARPQDVDARDEPGHDN